MRALLRPLFVGGLSVAIAAASLLGSSSVAFAASKPSITTWNLGGLVYEGDRPSMFATFTDGTDNDAYSVEIDWGDGSTPDPAADLSAGVTSFGATHVFADTGAYSGVVTLSDSASHTVTASSS